LGLDSFKWNKTACISALATGQWAYEELWTGNHYTTAHYFEQLDKLDLRLAHLCFNRSHPVECVEYCRDQVLGYFERRAVRDPKCPIPEILFQREKDRACQDSTTASGRMVQITYLIFSVLGSAHLEQNFGTRHCCCWFGSRNSGNVNLLSMLWPVTCTQPRREKTTEWRKELLEAYFEKRNKKFPETKIHKIVCFTPVFAKEFDKW
jgi:hypothetical protein